MAVTAELVPATIPVESGGSATFEVRLHNSAAGAATVRVRVEGEAAPFSWVSTETVALDPGGTDTVRVGFRLPKTAALRAGRLPFRVSAGGAGGAGGAVVEGALDVLPFAALSLSLDPPQARGRGPSRHEVFVRSRGNAPVDVHLAVTADAGLQAEIQPTAVRVSPDEPVTAVVSVRPEGRSANAERAFTVTASPQAGSPAEVRGTFVHRGGPRRGPVLIASAAVAGVAVVALVVGLLSSSSSDDAATTAATGSQPQASLAARDRCPAELHRDTFGIRNLDPTDIKSLPDSYSFLRVKADNCTPMRFNPCEPVHYIQNVAAAPPGVAADTREAFRRLGDATGITFVDDGTTDETVRAGPYVPERYPNRWAPILILWEHFPVQQTEGVMQIFGNTNVMREQEIVVSGRLRFNVDAYNDESTRAPIQPGFGPPADGGTGPIGRNNITWGRILLHELAHLAGLGHNRDQGSLMYPDAAQHTLRPTGFSAGDLAGLKYLGREAGCLRSPPLPT